MVDRKPFAQHSKEVERERWLPLFAHEQTLLKRFFREGMGNTSLVGASAQHLDEALIHCSL
jgi:hypothetical protein